MNSELFDDRLCTLGEGPLWHPQREQLFWFDILGKKLLSRTEEDGPMEWEFDEHVSAAGWIDHDTLLIASETALWQFDLSSGEQSFVHALEADNPVTRSNDGRADPWGGFWIGSMGHNEEPGAGSIHRYYRGELRTLVNDITVANAICFAPDDPVGYYTDSARKKIMRFDLDPKTGWPRAAARTHLDLTRFGSAPDGAVTDENGNLWLAAWGAARVVCYDPQGNLINSVTVAAKNASCPAFGGPNLRNLYVTSARTGLDAPGAQDGATFVARGAGQGVPEPHVIL